MPVEIAIAPESHPKPVPVYRRPAVLRLLLIALLGEIAYAILNISTMPVYLRADVKPMLGPIPNGREMGESVIGFVLVAFLLSEAVFKSPMGSLADRYGHKRLMMLGPALSIFTPILTLFVPHPAGFWEVAAIILLRVIDGLGSAMLWPAAFALMGNSVKDDERQQAMSLLNLCYMLGIALALPIGGIVNDMSGHKWASMILATVLFCGIVLAAWRGVPNDAEHEAVHASEGHPSVGFGDLIRSIHTIPSYMLLAGVTFCGIGFPTGIIKIFATDEFNLSEAQFGGLVFPAAIGMAAFSVPLSRFGERLGRARAVHYGMALCASGLVFVSLGAVFPILRATWVLALGGLPIGLGFLLAIPAWMASVSDIDPLRRGANIGAIMTAQGLGAIVGVPIGSTLYEKFRLFGAHFAHYSPFVGCAVCIASGWALSLKLLREPKR